MTHPTILTDAEILDALRPLYNGLITDGTILDANRDEAHATARAVIEKLGAREAVPVATVSGEVRRVCNGPGNYWNVGTILLCSDSHGATLDPGTKLYDATALAQAEARGRQQGYEATLAAPQPAAQRTDGMPSDDAILNALSGPDDPCEPTEVISRIASLLAAVADNDRLVDDLACTREQLADLSTVADLSRLPSTDDTTGDRLDRLAAACEIGSQAQSDLYAAGAIWRKHLSALPAGQAQQDAEDATRQPTPKAETP